MRLLISIALGGALGALARHFLSALPSRLFSISSPWAFLSGTLLVNVLGSFIIGLLWVLIDRGTVSAEIKPLLLTGFLGALTTFSTYSLQNVQLLIDGDTRNALINIVANNVLAISFAWLGILSGGRIAGG